MATHAGPQSSRNSPTPSTPFAPSVSSVFSDVPELEHADGTAGVEPIICTAVLLACSPPILMSADATGPQVKPSRNEKHSATGAPLESVCGGRFSVTALPRTRSPVDPVSTRMPSIVWHDEEPGTQIVTDVNAPLK